MSIKSKILAAASVLTLAGGVAATGAATPARAATPSCGGWPCVDIFSHEFTDYYTNPTYVLDVFRGGAKVGQPIILFKGSNSDKAEDFTVSFQGTVSDFYASGLVSSTVALHYGCSPGAIVNINGSQHQCSATSVDEPAFEIEYAPAGEDTGLCVGVPQTAFSKEKVALEPCGVSAKTTWVWDTYDQCAPFANPLNCTYDGFTFPAINGSDTNFSHPFVLTYPRNAEPWAKPRVQLTVTNLTGFSNGNGPTIGQIPDWQLWGGDVGVLP